MIMKLKLVNLYCCLVILVILYHRSHSSSWDQWWAYDGISGPDYWGLINPKWILCNKGRHQSPIDVQPDQLLYDPQLKPLQIQSSKVQGLVENTGRGVLYKLSDLSGGSINQKTFGLNSNLISSPSSSHPVIIGGGPFSYNYTLHHLQLHMGADNIGGSEHRISGQQFAGELQLIAYNSQLYSNFSDAESGPNGLAALSLLIQPCNFEHPQPTVALGRLLDIVLALAEKDDKETFAELDLDSLLSEERVRQYITYYGSLTQPPCSENVVWVLANRPLYLSVRQLELLRNVAEHENGLVYNWRPVQPVGKRCVRTNIQFQASNEVGQLKTCSMRSPNSYYANRKTPSLPPSAEPGTHLE